MPHTQRSVGSTLWFFSALSSVLTEWHLHECFPYSAPLLWHLPYATWLECSLNLSCIFCPFFPREQRKHFNAVCMFPKEDFSFSVMCKAIQKMNITQRGWWKTQFFILLERRELTTNGFGSLLMASWRFLSNDEAKMLQLPTMWHTPIQITLRLRTSHVMGWFVWKWHSMYI